MGVDTPHRPSERDLQVLLAIRQPLIQWRDPPPALRQNSNMRRRLLNSMRRVGVGVDQRYPPPDLAAARLIAGQLRANLGRWAQVYVGDDVTAAGLVQDIRFGRPGWAYRGQFQVACRQLDATDTGVYVRYAPPPPPPDLALDPSHQPELDGARTYRSSHACLRCGAFIALEGPRYRVTEVGSRPCRGPGPMS